MSEEKSMIQKPRFVWAIDFGQIATIVSVVLPLGGVFWYQASMQAEMKRDILTLQTTAQTYVPRVDSIVKNDDVQNERIGNLSDAVRDIRRTNSDILTQMGGVREDLAGIKGRLMLQGPVAR